VKFSAHGCGLLSRHKIAEKTAKVKGKKGKEKRQGSEIRGQGLEGNQRAKSKPRTN